MSSVGRSYSRSVYGLSDLLGELGGVFELILLIFGFFLFPISEHSFILKAGQKLFYAKSPQNTTFPKHQDQKTRRFLKSQLLSVPE